VWICADVFIGPDVRVGDNSIVAAGAMVATDAPAESVSAGSPAQAITKWKPFDRG